MVGKVRFGKSIVYFDETPPGRLARLGRWFSRRLLKRGHVYVASHKDVGGHGFIPGDCVSIGNKAGERYEIKRLK